MDGGESLRGEGLGEFGKGSVGGGGGWVSRPLDHDLFCTEDMWMLG